MKLQDILDLLVSGELANLAYTERGEICEDKIPSLIKVINLGLTKLYTRFKLKRGFCSFNVTADNLEYVFTADNVQSLDNPTGYLFEGFRENVLEITDLTHLGTPLSLDGSGNVVLLSPIRLKFKTAPSEGVYTIEYIALPDKVTYVDHEDLTQSVELPDVYVNALLYFVGSRLHSGVGVALDSNRNSLDITYMQRYEAECQQLENKGVDVDTPMDSAVFYEKGFI